MVRKSTKKGTEHDLEKEKKEAPEKSLQSVPEKARQKSTPSKAKAEPKKKKIQKEKKKVPKSKSKETKDLDKKAWREPKQESLGEEDMEGLGAVDSKAS